MGHNHFQVGALSLGTRMATSLMPNTEPIATPHQSEMSLSGLPNITLCTTMPGNYYPNYTVTDHEGFIGTPSASDAPYLSTCP